MAKKPAVKKLAPTKKAKPAPAKSKQNSTSRVSLAAKKKMPEELAAEHVEASAPAIKAQRLHTFTCEVGPSDVGDRIVEVSYPDEISGEILAIFFQPARAADSIPDDWTEQHAVQLLRFSREAGGTATVRIHRVDHGWNGRGWAGNLTLHVMVAAR